MDDDTDEADGSIKVTVIEGTYYKVGDDSVATVTVTDDDLPVVTIAEGASITEGADKDVTFTLSREGVTTETLMVNVRVEQEGDYIEGTASTMVNFAVNAPTAELTINLVDDDIDEADGSIKVTVIEGTSYKVGDDSIATVTVTDDDLPVVTIAGSASVTEGADKDVTFTLSREGVTTETLMVNVRVEQEGDYIEGTASTMVNFAVNAPTAELAINLENDDLDEADGSIKVTVVEGTSYKVGDGSATTVIVVDNDLPMVTITEGVSVTEGMNATFTLTRTRTTSSGTLMVNVKISQEGDYVSGVVPATVNFEDGKDTKILTVATMDDATDELNGIITATIVSGTDYEIGAIASAFVGVLDDDGTVDPEVRIIAVSSSVVEGTDVGFTLTRATTSGALTVNVEVTQDGSYISGALPTEVIFSDGVATATLTITTDNDNVDEADGSVAVTIKSGTGYTVGDPNEATVTLTDDDLPVVTITEGALVIEGMNVTFMLTRTTSSGALTVNVAVTQSGDYIAGTAPTIVDFTDGSATATLTIPTVDDATDESNGTITATVVSGTGYELGMPASAFVGVSDDDGEADPEVRIMAVYSSVVEGTDVGFTLTRATTSGALTVNVEVTQDGSYISGALPTEVIFSDGVATATLTITTDNDNVDEADGSVAVTIKSGTGYTVGSPSTATTTVEDDDDDLPTVTIAGDASVTEGADVTLTLTRTTSSGTLAASVEVAQIGEYVDANATGTQTVNFAINEATATLTIATIDDETDETDGSVTVTIVTDGTGYEVGDPPSAMVTITDNDEETTVGLQEEEDRLYPNPVGDWLHVRISAEGRHRLTVYTLSGHRERTYRIKPKQGTVSLNVSDLPSGIYVVTLTDTSEQSTSCRMVKE